MAKERERTICVKAVFGGKIEDKDIFIDLILQKYGTMITSPAVDGNRLKNYNNDKVFSDVHVS